jgi:two-component system phosphate regulon sensor histidine kinase PhoR
VDEALFDRVTGHALYQAGGVQDRVWRVRVEPLDVEGDTRMAVIALRDETEFRRSERTRADFLANASHELRTPLASLAGFIETLRGHAREDAVARDRFLAIMHVQAERMRRLIDDLMSLSRIELGEHIPPSGRVDLSLAVIDVLDALGPLAEERGVTFRQLLPAIGEAVVTGDRDQILQVVQNLAENALKYTPSGGAVTVRLETEVSAVTFASPRSSATAHLSLLTPDHAIERRYASLRVEDEGPGIARANLPRLTERFYRVEGQKSGEHAGTGLGLAIVKHIVNRHRGGLTVESAEGRGAAFTVYMPMAAGEAKPESQAA